MPSVNQMILLLTDSRALVPKALLAFCVNANASVLFFFLVAFVSEVIRSLSADEVTLPYFNGSSLLEYPRIKSAISTTSIRVEVKVIGKIQYGDSSVHSKFY